MIQLRLRGSDYRMPQDRLRCLSRQLDRQGCVLLRRFFDPELLRLVQNHADGARFFHSRYPGKLGTELRMERNDLIAALYILMHQPGLLRVMRMLTGCFQIRSFMGRIYRLIPGRGDTMQWHTDFIPAQGRLIGVSVNVSRSIYEGGVFHIRDTVSKKVLRRVANVGFGDALIFRISPRIDHRITDVRGRAVKTAFVGWFTSGPPRLPQLAMRPASRSNPTRRNGFSPMALDQRVRLSKNVFYQPLENGAVLFGFPEGNYCKLNSQGRRVWELLERSNSLQAAFDGIRKEYQVAPARMKRDILRLAGDLQEAGFLKVG